MANFLEVVLFCSFFRGSRSESLIHIAQARSCIDVSPQGERRENTSRAQLKLLHWRQIKWSKKVMDDVEFRKAADAAIEQLKQELYAAEDGSNFEVEERDGALYVAFEEPAGKFVISPNTPVRQIWISARSTSFKLDLTAKGFVLPRTGETLGPLVKRLIEEHAA